jgi:hypothetical protein
LLLMAFAEECVDRMHSSVAREHIQRLVSEHLLFTEGIAPPDGPALIEERTLEEVG